MKITIDTDVCIGFGNCERTCPKIFEVRSGISYAKVDEVPEEDQDCVREAESQCPSGAITTTE